MISMKVLRDNKNIIYLDILRYKIIIKILIVFSTEFLSKEEIISVPFLSHTF